uniref:Uncharacterized protein n=1 Tax=Globisporangium ultimum (strain ATCC 200006 / CBS 805.95 / DAOM BR144) TaxID=431595 RepID=K3W866_GLOUD
MEGEEGRLSDADAPPHSFASYSSEYYQELDEEEALRKAARAGILLLEKNQELHEENDALRAQLAILENERPSLRTALTAKDDEIMDLKEERKKCLVEINSLRNELKAKSALVTDLLDREQRFKVEMEDADATKRLAEYQLENLQIEFNTLQKKQLDAAAQMRNQHESYQYSVTNPAATYDSNQASVFTWADYEELLQKWQTASQENDAMQLELKSVRKDVDSLRKKAAKATEYYLQVEKLDKKNKKLQNAHDALQEELTEERAVLESLRTMNLMYKQIADSRPFALDTNMVSSTTAVDADPDAHKLGITVQDVLLDTNMKLEAEVRELRNVIQQQSAPSSMRSNGSILSSTVPSTRTVLFEDNDGNSTNDATDVAELKRRLNRVSSNNYEECIASDTASVVSDSNGDHLDAALHDGLLQKVQALQEKLVVAKDMLKHTKLQWSAAVASQKALEECNKSAQEEITRLTQQLDYQMSSMATNPPRDSGESNATRRRHDDDDDDDKWVEETAPYPAPPGDLNSPLIKCLLDHWTTDKAKIMALTDWLHHAIRGTGKPTPLRLNTLTSEVAAGFAQLLVPIMREKHGVSVAIYRRDSVHVLSDLILQTTQPSPASVPSYTTSTASTSSSPSSSAPHAKSTASQAAHEGPSQQRSRFLRGEAQFLYG